MLRDERKRRGWSMMYVGNMIGISKQYICDIEMGRRQPSYKVLIALENLFQKSHRELIPQIKK